jgi:hypothetical protein
MSDLVCLNRPRSEHGAEERHGERGDTQGRCGHCQPPAGNRDSSQRE